MVGGLEVLVYLLIIYLGLVFGVGIFILRVGEEVVGVGLF